MQRKAKPGRITLERLYPVCQYAAALLIAVSLHVLPEQITVLPGRTLPRAAMMIWILLLLGDALLADLGCARALKKDREELAAGVRYGGMNRSTLLALVVPVLFLLDAAAVAHLYYVYLNSGMPPMEGISSAGAAVMAVGIVLWIYGRRMANIRFGSIWGIRSRAAMADAGAWQRIHARAARPTCLFGAAALAADAFLPQVCLLPAALVCCAGAFAVMFSVKG